MPLIDANGTSIAFTQTGSGPPLVLIHGAEADHSMFDAFAVLLAPHFTVIAYDQRDSGGTRNPADAYGLDELADDAAALIAGLGHRRTHVFGTSLGGVIAQVLAVRHPERVDRLVLSSTFRAGTPPLSINPAVFSTLGALRARLPDSAAEIARYFFPDEHIARHPGVVSIFSGSSRTAEQRQRRAGILARPVAVDPGRIVAPTLVLVAADDRLIPPAHTLSLANEIGGARTATLAGIGHVATIQDPAAVARPVIAFLEEGASTRTIGGNSHERSDGRSPR
ncbi:MAG: alpha/beta fold hydrolase [Reyranella sp.]|uniref:alpha/beta fold hydrolase n=1 Tax=Reyranella sp. TaxID=1929291 RepID=UPI003D0EE3FD